jgi:hypothetical protein
MKGKIGGRKRNENVKGKLRKKARRGRSCGQYEGSTEMKKITEKGMTGQSNEAME